MPVATLPASNTPAKADGKEAAVAPAPFIRGAKEHTEPFYDGSQIITASATQISPIDVAPYGWLRGVHLLVDATGGVASVTVAAQEDAPWCVLQNITLTDTNGTPVFGPLDGYDLYLINRYTLGANQDPVNNPRHSAVATGASASGNFAFYLYLPLEASPVDGFCALPNASSAATYKLAFTVAPSSVVYSTAPNTTLPTVRVRAYADCYSTPPAVDANGVPNMQQPPFAGSTMFTSRQQYAVNSGQFRVRLTRVGNLIRSLIFIFRVSSSRATGETNLPSTLRVEVNKVTMHNLHLDILRTWIRNMTELAKDSGVFVLDFTHDASGKVGFEMRNKYLMTTLATSLELDASWGSAGTLTVITQDVAPKGGPYPAENY